MIEHRGCFVTILASIAMDRHQQSTIAGKAGTYYWTEDRLRDPQLLLCQLPTAQLLQKKQLRTQQSSALGGSSME